MVFTSGIRTHDILDLNPYLDVRWSWREGCNRDGRPVRFEDNMSTEEAGEPENEIEILNFKFF